MRKASEVLSCPSRLRATSAWLRTWMTVSAVTSRTTRPTMTGARRRPSTTGEGHVKRGVVGGQGDVAGALPGHLDLEVALPALQVAQACGVGQQAVHLGPVADRRDLEGGLERRPLVDDNGAA